jgi:hypothetical protein
VNVKKIAFIDEIIVSAEAFGLEKRNSPGFIFRSAKTYLSAKRGPCMPSDKL